MRKVTEKTATALLNGQSAVTGNTSVTFNQDRDRWELRLHNNLIAYRTCGVQRLYISNANGNIVTIKERLNGILKIFNTDTRIYRKNVTWYLWNYKEDVSKVFEQDTFTEIM